MIWLVALIIRARQEQGADKGHPSEAQPLPRCRTRGWELLQPSKKAAYFPHHAWLHSEGIGVVQGQHCASD